MKQRNFCHFREMNSREIERKKSSEAFSLPSLFPIGRVEEVQLKRELEAGEEVVQGPGGVVVHVYICEFCSNNKACRGEGGKERKKERKKEG
jgi:hypothetical protein